MTELSDYPATNYDKLRYGDTDRQGHINNAVFTSLFETGRVAVLHSADGPLAAPGHSFVLARIAVDYRAEMFWPGLIQIGSGVKSIGNSSVTFVQALFQEGRCVAIAQSVVVQVEGKTRRPAPIGQAARARLESILMKTGSSEQML